MKLRCIFLLFALSTLSSGLLTSAHAQTAGTETVVVQRTPAKATGKVPTVQANGTVQWATPAAGASDWASLTGKPTTLSGFGIVDAQPLDSDLTYLAGFTLTANVKSVLNAADYAAIRTLLGLVIGTNVQAFDADLTYLAGFTPTANVKSVLNAADYAAIKTLLALTVGTDVQAYDQDLTDLADGTWTAASASQAFAQGAKYTYTLTSNLTASSFTGTTVNRRIVVALLGCSGTHSFTFPSSKRWGSADAGTTSLTPSAGNHVFVFTYIGTTWYYSDSVTGALNLAGGSTVISGTLPVGNGGTGITALGTGVAAALGNTTNATGGLLTTDGTASPTNKTYDAAATGNVLKLKGYVYLTHPHLADGTNATIGTTATAIDYGHATFSNSVDQASNYVEYFLQVPEDIDTSVALRARIKVRLGGADTATQRYVLSSVSVADSAVPTSSTLANAINVDFAGDASGASGDVETSAWTTLTSWNGALTAGQTWRIRFARDGDTSDVSTVNSTELGLVIEYGITQ